MPLFLLKCRCEECSDEAIRPLNLTVILRLDRRIRDTTALHRDSSLRSE